MDFSSLLSLGVTAYSAYQSKSAAEDAASAQVTASDETIAFSKWLYEQQVELQQPYYDAGLATLPMLQARAGVKASTNAPTLQEIPRYSAEQASQLDNVYDYVSNLYIEGLGREGTQENIEKWANRLASGELTKSSIVDSFMSEAEANGLQFDRSKLTSIKDAVAVGSSTMATTNYQNYLNSVNDDGSDSSNYGESVSTMGADSEYSGLSFSGISSFADTYGKTASTGFTVAGPYGAIAAVLGHMAYNSLSDTSETGLTAEDAASYADTTIAAAEAGFGGYGSDSFSDSWGDDADSSDSGFGGSGASADADSDASGGGGSGFGGDDGAGDDGGSDSDGDDGSGDADGDSSGGGGSGW